MSHFFDAKHLSLLHTSHNLEAQIALPSSKSESNRALIINALSGNQLQLSNLSQARDTQTMIRLLNSPDLVLDVLDAGTTMRFLTAFCVATQRKSILTGTERMCERPIGILVDALRSLGANISYQKKDGFPPIQIEGFEPTTKYLAIRGDISSQYISALLMIAPLLPEGLDLELSGQVASKPYIQMTLDLMTNFGISYEWHENFIRINAQKYQAASYAVESDWSGASYWYSMVALSEKANIKLLGLKEKSLQGDKKIVDIMQFFGVDTVFETDGIRLVKQPARVPDYLDFTQCPDLAQTIAVLAAAKSIPLKMTGLQSLRIKETDRISALVNELAKCQVYTEVIGDSELWILPSHIQVPKKIISTYDDHRMAMAFAPLALLFKIGIENPKVVAKSYPSFWEDLQKVGFEIA